MAIPLMKKSSPNEKSELFRSSWSPFSLFQREFGRLFDDFYMDWSQRPSTGSETSLSKFNPNIEIAEDDNQYHVSAELPGLEDKDIELSIHDNLLTIKGEKRMDFEESKDKMTRSERTYGYFARTIPFSHPIDESKVEARMKKGVLNIVLPKDPSMPNRAKKIQIKT